MVTKIPGKVCAMGAFHRSPDLNGFLDELQSQWGDNVCCNIPGTHAFAKIHTRWRRILMSSESFHPVFHWPTLQGLGSSASCDTQSHGFSRSLGLAFRSSHFQCSKHRMLNLCQLQYCASKFWDKCNVNMKRTLKFLSCTSVVQFLGEENSMDLHFAWVWSVQNLGTMQNVCTCVCIVFSLVISDSLIKLATTSQFWSANHKEQSVLLKHAAGHKLLITVDAKMMCQEIFCIYSTWCPGSVSPLMSQFPPGLDISFFREGASWAQAFTLREPATRWGGAHHQIGEPTTR